MKLSRVFLASLAACAWLHLTAPVQAQADDARQAQELFAKGEQAFSSDRFTEAAQLFEAADQRSPHASVIYNAAVSWDQAGELARAADCYLEALNREGLDKRQALDAETRIGALRERLGFVQITKPAGGLVSVAHKRRTPLPAYFYLKPGDYEVLLESSNGGTNRTAITAVAGETLRLELVAPSSPADTSGEPVRKPVPDRPLEVPEKPTSSLAVVGWTGVALGLVAGGVAAYLGSRALAEERRYNDEANPPRTRNQALERARDYQLGTNVAWAGSAVFGSAGLVLVLTSPSIEF